MEGCGLKGRSRRRRVGWVPRIKYLDRPSPVQRLNPLPKLVALVGVTVAVFLLQGTLELLAVLAALLVLFAVARVGLWEMRSATRFFVAFSALLLLVHALFVHRGATAWEADLGPLGIEVAWGGLRAGVDMVLRFLVIVLGSFIFVATTEPNALAHSLMKAGVPYRAGFALVLALRLMPLVRSESSTVREAQAARGLELESASPAAVVRSVRSTWGPLLVSSLARVDHLVVSMEGRAFGRSRERTFLRETPWRSADSAVLVLGLVMPVAAALTRWFPL